jgi:uncharacterized protein
VQSADVADPFRGSRTVASQPPSRVPRTRGQCADRRVSEVDNGRALYELFVCISVGTALAEELLFRSALTAVLAQRRSMRIAIAAFAIVFGLWHVLPTIKSIESHPGGGERIAWSSPTRHRVAGVAASTAIASVVFRWLQRQAHSVLAPAVAHAVLS